MDDALRAVGVRLRDAAREAKAFGLAGAHIGEVAPVVVMSADPEGTDYLLMFNPAVIDVSPETVQDEEGSVSLPGVRVDVARPIWAEIAYMDEQGAPQRSRFERFAARVALHEIEQMQGIFFLEKVSRLKRDMALKKARKRTG